MKKKQHSKHTFLGIILILLGIILLGVVAFTYFRLSSFFKGGSENISHNKNLETLAASFNNIYPENIPPSGNVHEVTLEAKESAIEIIEGYKTNVWSYNEQVPGPEIRITKGDTIKLTLVNNLLDETTIHWHGVRVPNEMDGVPHVTQDPVQPGETFVYEFTPKDAGTYWFHPHVRGSEQLERGLYGTLIVEDPDEHNLFSSDNVLVLDDWRLTEDAQVNPNFLLPHDVTHDGRWGNVITINGDVNPEYAFKPGERIRLRLVNTSNARIYKLFLGNLNAQVIAFDGLPVAKTFSAEGFELAPGNRIDLDITLPNSEGTYSVLDVFTGYQNELFTIKTKGEPISASKEKTKTISIPDVSSALTAETDMNYVLNGGMGSMMMGRGNSGTWTINGEVYPNITQAVFDKNALYKVSFINESVGIHPMHFHGLFFKVLARDGKEVNEPYMQDTVLVHPEETVDVLMMPKDSGTWAMHCHIQEHADAVMMTLFEVK